MITTKKLNPVLKALARADTIEDLKDACIELRDMLQIDHVSYYCFGPGDGLYGYATYSMEWKARYAQEQYMRIDPVLIGGSSRFQPFNWGDLDWTPKAARKFRVEAAVHGVGSQGYSVPVHGPKGQFALFSVNHSCEDAEWAAFTRKHQNSFILLSHFFNQKALEVVANVDEQPTKALSPRELDAMTLLARGLSRAEVAKDLDISEHTLRVYIESARNKLNAQNTTHAVARALSRGLIVA
jgi:LuxR family transcriptional regulator, quorum-sensing system regulator RaiR